MNIIQYLENPQGKGAIIPGKNFIIDDYNNRFMNLVMKSKIKLQILIHGDDYYFHLLIPTESEERDNTYDIVIKFYTDNKELKTSTSIKSYDIEVFSNCPSFTYTYAYAYSINNLIIDSLKSKYGKDVLNKPPVSRNPSINVSYEKSIYFACKYIVDDNTLLMKSRLKKDGKKLDKKYLDKEIRDIEKISFEIKASKSKSRMDKKEIKTKYGTVASRTSNDNLHKPIKKITGSKSNTKNSGIKKIGKIKARKR